VCEARDDEDACDAVDGWDAEFVEWCEDASVRDVSEEHVPAARPEVTRTGGEEWRVAELCSVPLGEPHNEAGVDVHEAADDEVDGPEAEIGGGEDVAADGRNDRVQQRRAKKAHKLEQASQYAALRFLRICQRKWIRRRHRLQEEELGLINGRETGSGSPTVRHFERHCESQQTQPPTRLPHATHSKEHALEGIPQQERTTKQAGIAKESTHLGTRGTYGSIRCRDSQRDQTTHRHTSEPKQVLQQGTTSLRDQVTVHGQTEGWGKPKHRIEQGGRIQGEIHDTTLSTRRIGKVPRDFRVTAED